jgi:chemotaxis protein methyltransferase CheR
MAGDDCVHLLQWCLPRLGMRWRGFRRVRRQVCRRIARRIAELDLGGCAAYRAYLAANPDEWKTLDAMCRITISRFFRDRVFFERLRNIVLPDLVARLRPEEQELRAWSVGCASGEEAYSLRILWDLDLGPRIGARPRDAEGRPGGAVAVRTLRIMGTDIDPHLLSRARRAVYPSSALREVPAHWRRIAFEETSLGNRLRDRHRHGVEFREGDIRAVAVSPQSRFHMVLCRNLAFTYFSESLQLEICDRLRVAIEPGGALVVGAHERLPTGSRGFAPWPDERCVYQATTDPAPTSARTNRIASP